MKRFTARLIGIALLTGTACADDFKNVQALPSAPIELIGGQVAPAFPQNTMPPSVIGAFQAKLVPPANNAALVASFASARSLIEGVIAFAACGVGPYPQNGGQDEIEAWSALGRWIDPDSKPQFTLGSFPLPIWHTKYHPKASCMSILRTDRWSKPSKNTLAFRVQFVSDASDETVFVTYLFKRIEDGSWLYSNASL